MLLSCHGFWHAFFAAAAALVGLPELLAARDRAARRPLRGGAVLGLLSVSFVSFALLLLLLLSLSPEPFGCRASLGLPRSRREPEGPIPRQEG